MTVSEQELRRIAALARLGLEPARVPALVEELNAILGHMAVLQRVDTSRTAPVVGVGAGGMPLRADQGPAYQLAQPLAAFAPATRGGFLVVPRLATHADAGGDGAAAGATAGDEIGAEPESTA